MKQALIDTKPEISLNKVIMFVVKPAKTPLTVEDELNPDVFRVP